MASFTKKAFGYTACVCAFRNPLLDGGVNVIDLNLLDGPGLLPLDRLELVDELVQVSVMVQLLGEIHIKFLFAASEEFGSS